jgi:uncharacterized protein YecA (UPF0149 family)
MKKPRKIIIPAGSKAIMVDGNGFALARKKINRNAPCECGSGKKAKNCCGDETKYVYSKLNDNQIKEREEKAAAALKEDHINSTK